VLRTLRKPGETGYKIPHGGLYRFISSPNYFGELLEWSGFAIAAQTLAGWAFFFFTFANLAPRAVSHHRWYREKFSEYPSSRRALIPFLW
jgi:steroid 5-alpha reductase family enzyme